MSKQTYLNKEEVSFTFLDYKDILIASDVSNLHRQSISSLVFFLFMISLHCFSPVNNTSLCYQRWGCVVCLQHFVSFCMQCWKYVVFCVFAHLLSPVLECESVCSLIFMTDGGTGLGGGHILGIVPVHATPHISPWSLKSCQAAWYHNIQNNAVMACLRSVVY